MTAMKAYIRPRPIRVAFLVEMEEHWKLILDAILAECYGRWGGRFSLLVPCERGKILPAYTPWLETYDPDIIYSYVDLADSVIERLHDSLYPSFLVRHTLGTAERDMRAFRPQLPVSPLNSLSVALATASERALSASSSVSLIDTYLTPPPLLQENFGCLNQSLSTWPLAADVSSYLRTLMLVPQKILDDPKTVPRPQGEFVTETIALLNRISKQRDLWGLAQLSARLCPRLEMYDSKWGDTVNLIIGDSFADLVTFWNAQSYLPVWTDGGVVTLRISREDIEKRDVFAAILGIITKRIKVGNSPNSHIILRSASYTQEELEEFLVQFRNADKWNRYSCERIDSVESCAPSQSILDSAHHDVDSDAWFMGHDWHEIIFSENIFRPPTIAPRHIRHKVPLPSSINHGLWSLDLDIERSVDYSRFQNIHHRWRLPQRLRMISAFSPIYQAYLHGPICIPRATHDGLLSLFATIDGELPELSVPNDETAFRFALCAPPNWMPFSHGRNSIRRSIVCDIRPSDKGRYLTALLRLSDGIHRAKQIFLNGFWKAQFERLGTKPSTTEDGISYVIGILQKRFPSGEIRTQADKERLARVVLSEARAVRLGRRYLKYDYLRDRFEC